MAKAKRKALVKAKEEDQPKPGRQPLPPEEKKVRLVVFVHPSNIESVGGAHKMRRLLNDYAKTL